MLSNAKTPLDFLKPKEEKKETIKRPKSPEIYYKPGVKVVHNDVTYYFQTIKGTISRVIVTEKHKDGEVKIYIEDLINVAIMIPTDLLAKALLNPKL